MRKTALWLVLVLFAMGTAAYAQSDKVDGFKGNWNVTMEDGSTVQWNVLDTVYISSSGASHIGYGIRTPGDVEFEIFWQKFVQDNMDENGKKYFYIEKPHAEVPDYNGLPQDMTQYTAFTPVAEAEGVFTCFTATPGGPYPLASGAREGATCDNIADNCTDADGDGYFAGAGCTPLDCDDTDPALTDNCAGCPIATLLGSDAESLRFFRDSTLAKSALGRSIIQIYYSNASSINAALDKSPVLRSLARTGLQAVAGVINK